MPTRSLVLPGCLLFAAAFVLSAGCGNSKYDLVTVTGTITMDGKPLEGASVKFQPKGGGAMSFGKTDAQGRYQLETIHGDPGAMVATHKVSVFKSSGSVDTSTEEVQPQVKQLIPERYNYKSELTYEVKPGNNDAVDFTLTSK